MSGTPNYGFESTCICTNSDSAIDRELKRIEDKADTTATLLTESKEQIIRNQEHIQCLSGRVDRADSDIADRYTKAEVDTKLECKASKCELEKHIVDPHAHQELFDRKVDKREGYDLISDADLAQVTTNKDDIAALDSRVTTNEVNISKTYTQEEVDAFLANKANVGPLIWYQLPIAMGWQTYVNEAILYAKDSHGTIHINGSVSSPSLKLTPNRVIATLPEGFRPIGPRIYFTNFYGEDGFIFPVGINISIDGTVSIYGSNRQDVLDNYVLNFIIPLDVTVPFAQ